MTDEIIIATKGRQWSVDDVVMALNFLELEPQRSQKYAKYVDKRWIFNWKVDFICLIGWERNNARIIYNFDKVFPKIFINKCTICTLDKRLSRETKKSSKKLILLIINK